MATRSLSVMLPLALLLIAAGIAPTSSQSTCATRITVQGRETRYARCLRLTQGATIAWTFDAANLTMEMAFSGVLPSTSGWVGWGYNPNRTNMEGAAALLAYSSDSTARLGLYSLSKSTGATPINTTAYFTILDRNVAIQGTSVSFTAHLQFPENASSINHIWNRGSSVSGNIPAAHAFTSESTTSFQLLNLVSGGASSQASIPRLHLKNAHGLVNGIGWGILLPIGAMAARYLRPFEWADPAWFYLHILAQTSGYILGVVGWAIGLKLGSDSVGVKYNSHRSIGITMFVFGTLQVFAIILRPNKNHQYRLFWNAYHHSLGYTTIILAIVNIFKGLDILQPAKGWKRAYIGCIIALGVISLVFEVITWIAYFKRRSSKTNKINKSSNPYGNEHDEAPALRV